MPKPTPSMLTDHQIERLNKLNAVINRPRQKSERVILSGQVAPELEPYVNDALKRMTKTELMNAGLAALFEVQVYEASASNN